MAELHTRAFSLLLPWSDCARCRHAVRRAQKAWRRGDAPRAEELFEQALSFGLTDSRPYVQYASMLLEQGEAGRAAELLQNAAEVEPASPVPLIFLGLAESDSGRQVEACSALQDACKKAPHNLLAKSCLALARLRAGQVKQAAEALLADGIADNLRVRARLLVEVERLLRLAKRPRLVDDLLPPAVEEPREQQPGKDWSGRRCLKTAIRAFGRGEFRSARALLKAAADRGCAADECLLYLAGADMGMGDYRGASLALLKMPEKSTLRGTALFYAAVGRYLDGHPAATLDLLGQAAAAGNVHDFEEFIFYYRGLCLLAAGDDLAARSEFARALDLDWALLPRRIAAL